MFDSNTLDHRTLSAGLLTLLAVVLLPFSASAQTVPTDGLQLWLRANAVEATDGATVDAWPDRSPNGRALSQPDRARQPTYVANAINGHPLLRFDENDQFDTSLLPVGSGYTILRVTRQKDRGYVSVAEGTIGEDKAGSTVQRFLQGQVAEVLVYDRRLSETEKKTVSEALGQRYNLGPGATTARSGDATDATTEGVRVHGSWTITVRNPDGSLDERQSFENAFQNAALLSDVVAAAAAVGTWWVEVESVGGTQPCETSGGSDSKCRIIEEGDDSANWIFPGLSVTAPDSGDDANSTVLQGSFTAANDSDVGEVFTLVGSCAPSTAPDNCPASSSVPFTLKELSSTVPVSDGQQVSVRVVISFE